MRKSVTALAVLALGAMVAVGSATESMAHGGGGGSGHGGGGSHSGGMGGGGGHGFGGGGRGVGGFGRGDHGIGRGFGGGDHSFGGVRGVSHNRFGDHREHFRNFRRDDNYGYYSCEYPFRWNSPFDYCQ